MTHPEAAALTCDGGEEGSCTSQQENKMRIRAENRIKELHVMLEDELLGALSNTQSKKKIN